MILPPSETMARGANGPLQISNETNRKRKRDSEQYAISASEGEMGCTPIGRKLDDEEAPHCLGRLMIDVLVQIMGYLSGEERDNLAVASKACLEARNNRSLDQTRTGTVVVRRNALDTGVPCLWTAESLLLEMQSRGFQDSFAGNRTRLKVIGLEQVKPSKMSNVAAITRWMEWEHVTSLDISFPPRLDPGLRKVKNSVCKSLAMILPNLRILDMSYVKVTETAVNAFAKYCPNLEVFRWKGSDDGLKITGENLATCGKLKEIDIEGSTLYCSIRQNDTTPRFYNPNSDEFLEALQLFWCCSSSQLERVNIKGCQWYSMDLIMGYNPDKGALADIPNEAMVRFVRSTKSLKYFESDLPPETIAKLRIEFPDITFC